MSKSAILSNITSLFKHPLGGFKAIVRFLIFQVLAKRNKSSIIAFVNNTLLAVRKGQHGITRNVYLGLSDFENMSFLLHFLRKEDFFC